MSKTGTEHYSHLIGYNFGNMIYNGAYYNTETGKKQYMFYVYDDDMIKLKSQMMCSYKEFKEIINQYDYPSKKQCKIKQ